MDERKVQIVLKDGTLVSLPCNYWEVNDTEPRFVRFYDQDKNLVALFCLTNICGIVDKQ